MVFSPAERLIDEGHIVTRAQEFEHPLDVAMVNKMGEERVYLALLALWGTMAAPVVLFSAMMEGWSDYKLKIELDKLRKLKNDRR